MNESSDLSEQDQKFKERLLADDYPISVFPAFGHNFGQLLKLQKLAITSFYENALGISRPSFLDQLATGEYDLKPKTLVAFADQAQVSPLKLYQLAHNPAFLSEEEIADIFKIVIT